MGKVEEEYMPTEGVTDNLTDQFIRTLNNDSGQIGLDSDCLPFVSNGESDMDSIVQLEIPLETF